MSRGTIVLNPSGATAAVTVDGDVFTDASTLTPLAQPISVAAVTAVWVEPGRYTGVWSLSGVVVDDFDVAVGPSLSNTVTVVLRDLSPGEVQSLAGGGSGLPTPTGGDAGKVVTVNGAETGYELDPAGTSGPVAVDLPRGNFANQFGFVMVPTDTWTNPAWADNGGAGLLDLTDPTQPVLIRGGVISVSIEWQFTTASEATGKAAYIELDLDQDGDDANVSGNFSLDPLLDPAAYKVQCPLSLTYYVPAGGVISLAVVHDLGVDAECRLAQAWLQYLALDPVP